MPLPLMPFNLIDQINMWRGRTAPQTPPVNTTTNPYSIGPQTNRLSMGPSTQPFNPPQPSRPDITYPSQSQPQSIPVISGIENWLNTAPANVIPSGLQQGISSALNYKIPEPSPDSPQIVRDLYYQTLTGKPATGATKMPWQLSPLENANSGNLMAIPGGEFASMGAKALNAVGKGFAGVGAITGANTYAEAPYSTPAQIALGAGQSALMMAGGVGSGVKNVVTSPQAKAFGQGIVAGIKLPATGFVGAVGDVGAIGKNVNKKIVPEVKPIEKPPTPEEITATWKKYGDPIESPKPVEGQLPDRPTYIDNKLTELRDSKMYSNSPRDYQQRLVKEYEAKANNEWYDLNEKAYIAGENVPLKGRPDWSLTAKELADRQDDLLNADFIKEHKANVVKALSEGKPVPPEVLKDYPDLINSSKIPNSSKFNQEVESARYILRKNVFPEYELKGLQGLDPKYNPQGYPQEVWKEAFKQEGGQFVKKDYGYVLESPPLKENLTGRPTTIEKANQIASDLTIPFSKRANQLKELALSGEISDEQFGTLLSTMQETKLPKSTNIRQTKLQGILDKYDDNTLTVGDVADSLRSTNNSKIRKAISNYDEAVKVDREEYGMRSGLDNEAGDKLISTIQSESTQLPSSTPKPSVPSQDIIIDGKKIGTVYYSGDTSWNMGTGKQTGGKVSGTYQFVPTDESLKNGIGGMTALKSPEEAMSILKSRMPSVEANKGIGVEKNVTSREAPTLEGLSQGIKEQKGKPGITKELTWNRGLVGQETNPNNVSYVYRNEKGDIEGILNILGSEDVNGVAEYSVEIAAKPSRSQIGKQLIQQAVKDGYKPEHLVNPEQGYTGAGAKFTNRLLSEKPLSPIVETPAPKVESIAPKVEVPPVEPPVPPKVETGAVKQPDEFAGNIRLSKFDQSIHEDLKSFVDANPQKVEDVRRGVVPLKQTEANARQLIEETGGDFKKLGKKVGAAYNDSELRAISGALADARLKLNQLKDVIAQPNGNSTENLLRLAQLNEKANVLQLYAHAGRAEAGRALSSLRMMNEALNSGSNATMEKVLKQLGGRDKIEGLADAMKGLNWDDPVQVNNFIRSVNKPGAMDYINELFINSILSGPKTHMVNAISNNVNTMISPIERGLSALIEKGLAKVQGRQTERFFSEIPADIYGAFEGIPEGLRGALATVKTGLSPLRLSKYEYRPSAFKGAPGRIINAPVTALEMSDNINYHINFRQALNAEVVRAGRMKGLKGDALKDYIAETKLNPPKELIQKVGDISEYRLFRAEGSNIANVLFKLRDWGFDAGKLGKIQPLKYVIPFVRTPVNLVKYGLERSPLGILNPKLIHNLAKKNPEAADQLARVVMGSSVAAGIAVYFGQGKITGSVPRSITERDRFYREGKQPYSVKIGNDWVSYQRLEPFNQMFTQVAMVVDAVNNKDNKSIDQLVVDASANIGKNLVSQTYMSGVLEIINAISEPEIYGKNLLTNIATALAVPASSLTRTITQATDNIIRQPEGIVENIKTTIPGLSQQVNPRLNVFGESTQRVTPWFSPISVSPEQNSILNQELSKHNINTGFVADEVKDFKLNRDELFDYQTGSGQLVKKGILEAINTPEYQQATTYEQKSLITKASNKAKEEARKQYIINSDITQSKPNDTPEETYKRDDLSKVTNYWKVTDGIQDADVKNLVSRVLRQQDPDLEVALKLTGYWTGDMSTPEAKKLLSDRNNGTLRRLDTSYDPAIVQQIQKLVEPYYAVPSEAEITKHFVSSMQPQEIQILDKILEYEKNGNQYAANVLMYQNPNVLKTRQVIEAYKSKSSALKSNMKRVNPTLDAVLRMYGS